MLQSKLFPKTEKTAPKDEISANAALLIRGGFVNKETAGVYTFLPLGWRVLQKIENVVREEMNAVGGQEILMPALHSKDKWEKTGRWRSFDALFKLKSRFGAEFALGPTHEEILYSLLTQYVKSYRDLPLYLYQIQTKFRDEPRPKSGLLRGREFRMKDLYSFHSDNSDRDRYYRLVSKAYLKALGRMGLRAVLTVASGGTFSERSHEFQVVCPAGEDLIAFCSACRLAFNAEILSGARKCEDCGGALLEEEKAIEVGNIFPLKEKFAKDFNLVFKDGRGEERLVSVGCYGLGTSRAMGAIVETNRDEKGIIWPLEVAPFKVHLLNLEKESGRAGKIYRRLAEAGVEVLYDDRKISAGEKFADADLIGVPYRVVVSEKTGGKFELKKRRSQTVKLIGAEELIKALG